MVSFGWSLPPGVSTLPGEEPAGPCLICGGNVDADECTCEECPQCGACGCVEHVAEQELTHRIMVAESQAYGLRKELEKRVANRPPVKCHTCGAEYPVTVEAVLTGDPIYCDTCKEIV